MIRTPTAAPMAATWTHILLVARTRARYLLRSRVILLALALTVLPWFAADGHDAQTELALLTASALTALLASASGVVSESLDDGSYGIAVLHGLTPLEMVLGEALGALSGMLPALIAFAVLSAPALGALPLGALALCLAWLGVLLLGWLAIMLLLGTVLPGKGNAIAMIPLLLAFAFPSDAIPVDHWPPAIARAARAAWSAMPLEAHAMSMYGAILRHSPPPPAAPVALLLAPPVFLAVAALRLSRLDAARRFTG